MELTPPSSLQAQLMAKEYKARGGDYTTPKDNQDESQKHLSKWTEEEWQTKEGSGDAKKADGTRKRYLPKKAWEEMSEGEKEETEEKKVEGGKAGKQHVANTERAKRSRRRANDEEDEKGEEKKKTKPRKGRSAGGKSEEHDDGENQEEEEEADHDGEEDEAEEKNAKSGQKRGRGRPAQPASNKKQKANSGKGKQSGKATPKKTSEPPAKPGSKERLPKKGQKVHWHSLPGYIEGVVVEVAYEDKEVEGKRIRGKEDDPRIVLKSSGSGKIASHKPEVVFFD